MEKERKWQRFSEHFLWLHNGRLNNLWHRNQTFKQKRLCSEIYCNRQWLHWKKTWAQRGVPVTFNMIMWQSLLLQSGWETKASCEPTSSQPFHFSETLPVNRLYNIPGCGWAAVLMINTEAPSGRQWWGSDWLPTVLLLQWPFGLVQTRCQNSSY